MAVRTPGLQPRSEYHAYWGVYPSRVGLPNGTGNILNTVQFVLEAGDTAYVTGSGMYVCGGAGTAGGGDAAWLRVDTATAAVDVEIDFGSLPAWEQEFVVVDALVSPSSRVVAWQSSAPATGRVGNDTAWDQLLLATTCAAGQFVLTAYAVPGPVVGKRKIVYQVV